MQHVLFATGLSEKVMEGSQLKHSGEDWEFEAPFRYDFVSTQQWEARDQSSMKDTWTRRVTGLDDGLRFQCAAPWSTATASPGWSCGTFSPIPGRETRDIGRKDYQAMDRRNRVIRESWDQVFTGDIPLRRRRSLASLGRYAEIIALEKKYINLDLNNRDLRVQAKSEVTALIEAYCQR